MGADSPWTTARADESFTASKSSMLGASSRPPEAVMAVTDAPLSLGIAELALGLASRSGSAAIDAAESGCRALRSVSGSAGLCGALKDDPDTEDTCGIAVLFSRCVDGCAFADIFSAPIRGPAVSSRSRATGVEPVIGPLSLLDSVSTASAAREEELAAGSLEPAFLPLAAAEWRIACSTSSLPTAGRKFTAESGGTGSLAAADARSLRSEAALLRCSRLAAAFGSV